MAVNLTLQTERSFRQLIDLVDEGVEATKPVIARQIVMALQSGRSLWPVRTGLSKRSFDTRLRGPQGGNNPFGTVINRALASNAPRRTYANFVERGVNQPARNVAAARRTVELLMPSIVAAVERIVRQDSAVG